MKKFLTLLAAVSFAATTLIAQAQTPKAAEDPAGSVASANSPAPRVKAAAAKKHVRHARKAGKKKAHKVKHRKVRKAHRVRR